MDPSPPARARIFISYSHADKDWLERLKRHLKPLVRQGDLEVWDDTHIQPRATTGSGKSARRWSARTWPCC